jgi:hypothetical protein
MVVGVTIGAVCLLVILLALLLVRRRQQSRLKISQLHQHPSAKSFEYQNPMRQPHTASVASGPLFAEDDLSGPCSQPVQYTLYATEPQYFPGYASRVAPADDQDTYEGPGVCYSMPGLSQLTSAWDGTYHAVESSEVGALSYNSVIARGAAGAGGDEYAVGAHSFEIPLEPSPGTQSYGAALTVMAVPANATSGLPAETSADDIGRTAQARKLGSSYYVMNVPGMPHVYSIATGQASESYY